MAANSEIQPASKKGGAGRPFQPGQSGNPTGRPAVVRQVQELARAQTEAAIQTLVGIMTDRSAAAPARVSAASVILDRGWGKPSQPIEGTEDGPPIHVTIDAKNLPPESRAALREALVKAKGKP